MLSMSALRLGLIRAVTTLGGSAAGDCIRMHASPCLRTWQPHGQTAAGLRRSHTRAGAGSAEAGAAASSGRRALYPPLDIANRVVLVTGVWAATPATARGIMCDGNRLQRSTCSCRRERRHWRGVCVALCGGGLQAGAARAADGEAHGSAEKAAGGVQGTQDSPQLTLSSLVRTA